MTPWVMAMLVAVSYTVKIDIPRGADLTAVRMHFIRSLEIGNGHQFTTLTGLAYTFRGIERLQVEPIDD